MDPSDFKKIADNFYAEKKKIENEKRMVKKKEFMATAKTNIISALTNNDVLNAAKIGSYTKYVMSAENTNDCFVLEDIAKELHTNKFLGFNYGVHGTTRHDGMGDYAHYSSPCKLYMNWN